MKVSWSKQELMQTDFKEHRYLFLLKSRYLLLVKVIKQGKRRAVWLSAWVEYSCIMCATVQHIWACLSLHGSGNIERGSVTEERGLSAESHDSCVLTDWDLIV